MPQDSFSFFSPTENLLPHQGKVFYHGPIFEKSDSDSYLKELHRTLPWAHDEIRMFGKTIITERQMAWLGDTDFSYTYSGKTHLAHPWTTALTAIKARVEALSHTQFNSCLANLYQQGEQGMGWHQDNEKELGSHPTIASISFGAERRFDFRHKESREKTSVYLEHGSLLLMTGSTQTYWQHQLPKTKKVSSPRINLTFRTIQRVPRAAFPL